MPWTVAHPPGDYKRRRATGPIPPEGRQKRIASVATTGLLEGGELLIEVPLQVDAVGLWRHRATDDLNSWFHDVIAEFAEEHLA